jgi:3-methyladenine DNA glycosylase AlkC
VNIIEILQMSYQLKEIYSPQYFTQLEEVLSSTIPQFDAALFRRLIVDQQWQARALKDRMKHIATVLHQFLPADFAQSTPVLMRLIKNLKTSKISKSALAGMFLPDYIERYGIHHFKEAIQLFEQLTAYSSCEFAIRPFIISHEEQMIGVLLRWSLHKNEHVRRLASEGSRPRLPWAMALPKFKKDPQPVLPILENLKQDPSVYVRKSVANHLNDITKDNPAIVFQLIKNWKGISKETDGIIKHGCRSLLKQGHPEILGFYGLSSKELVLTDFSIATKKIKIGDSLQFSFTVSNKGRKSVYTRLEYAVYFLRQNGLPGKKVFKLREKELAAGSSVSITKNHSFRLITTRVYYPGQQFITIIVNGKESAQLPFTLK